MKNEYIGVKEALEILREKQAVSEPTFKVWVDSGKLKGIVTPVRQKRGMYEERRFKKSEILKLKEMLPKNRVIGKPLLPK